jgi:hypothetical protein
MSESIEKPKKKLIVKEIDLSKTWDLESQRDLIIQKLKKWRLYSENLLFKGFDASRIDLMKQHGTDSSEETIFCSTEEELTEDVGGMRMRSAINYAIRSESGSGAMAIYDKSKLIPEPIEFEYRLKDGFTFKDALLMIIILK